jgi:type VI protein secretion system component Hcp
MAIDTFIYFIPSKETGMKKPEGETQDDYFKTKKAFEIKDWSFDVSNKSTIGSATGGAGGGKAEFAEFSIQKMVDAASVVFFRNCVAGAHYDQVILACRKAGSDSKSSGAPYLTYTFGTVFTTKVAWKHSDDGPTEDIQFVYGTLMIEYQPQDKSGKIGSVKLTDGWSQLNNKAYP